jgi:hypothetical protein
MRHDPLRHLQLNHDVNRSNPPGALEQPVQDRRRDVVGQVAIDPELPIRECGNVGGENVSSHHLDAGPGGGIALHDFAKARRQGRIGLDCNHAATVGGKQPSHLAVAGADFNPLVAWVAGKRSQNSLLPA